MKTGIFFLIEAIFYMALLTIIYFKKERINKTENKIYSLLIVIAIIELLLELVLDFVGPMYEIIPLISYSVAKLYSVFLQLWITFICMYIVVLSLTMKKKEMYIKNAITFISVLSFIFACAIFILPLNFYYENGLSYTYGPSVNIIFVASGIFTFISFCCLIWNSNNFKDKRFIPLLIFILLGGTCSFIQNKYPGLLLAVPIHAFITFLMYFTIENPDLKMIEKLSKAKVLSENTNDEKSKFLFEVTNDIEDKLDKVEKIYSNVNELNPSDDIKEEMVDLKELVDNARTKIKQTIDVSELDTRHLRSINNKYNVKLLINSVYLQNKGKINKEIDYRLNINSGMPEELYGDSVKVKQIITTLLSNSIEYTEKGFIELRVNSIIKYDVCRLIISVEDSGCGIDLKKQNEILNNHADLTEDEIENKSNMDLNLKMIRKMVNLIGGSITIESKDGVGTKIMVILDQKIVENAKDEEEKQIEKYSLEVKNRTKIATILMDKNLEKDMKKVIGKYNYVLDTYDVTLDCLTKIRNDYKYDVIIIEEKMEKIDALSLKNKLKNEGYNPKVWVLTSSNDIRKRKELIDAGFEEVIMMPVDRDEFKKKLDLLKNN